MRSQTAIAAALVVALLGMGSAQAEGKSAKRPVLRLIDKQPITLRGVSFRARERVRVTVQADDLRRSRIVRASVRGAFVAQFDASLDRCLGLNAFAMGSNGSRATYKLPPPYCPPLP